MDRVNKDKVDRVDKVDKDNVDKDKDKDKDKGKVDKMENLDRVKFLIPSRKPI